MNCNTESKTVNIQTARALLNELDPSLRASVESAFAATRRDPLAGLVSMARLARHDLRVGYVVIALADHMLHRADDRRRVASIVAGFIPGAGAVPSRQTNGGIVTGSESLSCDSSVCNDPAVCLPPQSSAGAKTGRANNSSSGPEGVRIDPELARLTLLVGAEKYARIWLALRGCDLRGAGWVTRADLRAFLTSQGVTFGRRHINALLRSGAGFWWDLDNDTGRVYFAGGERLTRRLMVAASAVDPWSALATNLAGVADVYVSIAGSIVDFRRALYAGWVSSRENPTIARATLARLFGQDADTLRAWESAGPSSTLQARHNYAQAHLPDKRHLETDPAFWRLLAAVPAFEGDDDPDTTKRARQGYAWDGSRLAWWQESNTYFSTSKQHHCRGRAYKRRAVALSVSRDLLPGVLWPTGESSDSPAAGLPADRRYFEQFGQLRGYAGQRGGDPVVGLVWLGENWRQLRIFELTVSTDQIRTHVNSLARGLQARRYHSDARARLRSYVS